MRFFRQRWFIRVSIALFVVLVLPIIIAPFVFTSDRLSKIAAEYSEKYINGKVTFSDIKFNMFSYFPYATISIDDVEVISGAFNSGLDSLSFNAGTLLKLKQLNVAVNPIALLSSDLSIRYIGIKGMTLNGVVSDDGRANWDIVLPDSVEKTNDGESIAVALKELKITDGLIVDYRDYKTSDNYHLSLKDMAFKGNLTDDLKRLKIDLFAVNGVEINGDSENSKLVFSSLIDKIAITKLNSRNFNLSIESVSSIKQDTVEFCRELPVQLNGGIRFDSLSKGTILLDSLILKADDIATHFNGGVRIVNDSIVSDLVCTINPLKVASVINLIPEELAPLAKSISTNIAIDFNTAIKGSYVKSANRLPDINIDLKIDNGFLRSNKMRARIDTVNCDLSISYSSEKSNVFCNIRNLRMKGSGLDVDVKASVSDILTDPFVKGKMLFNIDLKQVTDSLSVREGVVANGAMSLDLDVEARQSWLNIKNIGRSTIVGRLVFDDLFCSSPKDSLVFTADGGVSFGSIVNKKDSLLGINSRIIGVSALFDTLNMNYKRRDLLALSKMKMSVRSSSEILSGDSAKTSPMNGVITSNLITCLGADSTMLLFHKLNGDFMILPSKEYAAAPHISTDFKSKIIYMRGRINRYVIYDAEVNLNSTLLTKNNMAASRREQMLDSLGRIYPTIARDSLFIYLKAMRNSAPDDFKGQDIDLKIDDSLADLFVKWGTTGYIKSKTAKVITPYLPLKTLVENVDIKFTQNEVDVTKTSFIIGDSKINLTGKISNIARALTRGAKLKVSSSITADSMNINQLNQAIANGLKFSERSAEFKDSVAISSNEEVEQMISQTNIDQTNEKILFIVPSNIDLNIHLDVDNCRYDSLLIECLSGDIISRDRCLQIKDLTAQTNAGLMNLSAIYSTTSKHDLRTGFDLEMNNIEVAKLINLMPEIDSLLPMLRSFDGVVDCNMAATASLDTAMNIVLPSLNAACAIRGNNMVLLDGETFAEIAKTLRFKNKKRNVIDKISVELLVKDNKIEVFPFLLSIDRYQTAISGVHNLDLTYKYHISVIDSPLPFRIGIDIFGNADDFKFKLTRARFKNTNLPSYVSMIDTARINLRDKIINIFKDKKSRNIFIEKMELPKTDTMSVILPDEQPLTQSDSIAIKELQLN